MDNGDKSKQEIDKIQDKFFWDIYGRPENTAGYLKDCLPPNIVKQLDLNFKLFMPKKY